MFPHWVEIFRAKGKEIKFIRGKYYLYERSTVWDKDKKMPKKISGAYLGRITPDGLVPPKKKLTTPIISKQIPNKEFGASAFLAYIGNDVADNLKLHFPHIWKDIFVISVLRTFDPQPFKQIQESYHQSFLSCSYPQLNLSKQNISSFLQSLGSKRIAMVDFMKEYLSGSEHVIFNGTKITSFSEKMEINQVGYNNKHSYDPQVNIVYAFSIQPETSPVYYRAVPGDICDVSAFSKSLGESCLDKAVIIADKGFGSEANFIYLEEAGLKYIVPLRRSSSCLSKDKLLTGYANGFEDFFMFHDRPIFYFTEEIEGNTYVTYIDGHLRLREETDYIRRIEENKESYTKARLVEARMKFGVIVIRTNLAKNPKEIYEIYKMRGKIEESFDTFKNLLLQDTSYMQSDISFEAWAFLNHISLMLCYRVYNMLKNKDLLKKYFTQDVFQLLSHIRKIYINDHWILSEISKKSRTLITALNFIL